jgi:hypothetical protein
MKRHWRRVSARRSGMAIVPGRTIAGPSRPKAGTAWQRTWGRVAFQVGKGLAVMTKLFKAGFYVTSTVAIVAFAFLQWKSSKQLTEIELARNIPQAQLKQNRSNTLYGAPPNFQIVTNFNDSEIRNIRIRVFALLVLWEESCPVVLDNPYQLNSTNNEYELGDDVQRLVQDSGAGSRQGEGIHFLNLRVSIQIPKRPVYSMDSFGNIRASQGDGVQTLDLYMSDSYRSSPVDDEIRKMLRKQSAENTTLNVKANRILTINARGNCAAFWKKARDHGYQIEQMD